MNNLTCVLFLASGIITGIIISYFYVRNIMKRYVIDRYAFGVLEQINIAAMIRDGKSENLVKIMEQKMPNYLQALNNSIKKEGDTLLAMQGIRLYYKKFSLKIPTEIGKIFETTPPLIIDKSKECYVLTDLCSGGFGCIPIPTSLRPTTDTIDAYNGFIRGSGCGVKPQFRFPFYKEC